MTPETIETLAVALATGNVEVALPLLSEDAAWEMVGRGVIVGRAAIATALTNAQRPDRVTIGRVFATGGHGVVEGEIELSPTHHRRFCDLYESSATIGSTIRRITSWDVRA